MLPSFTCIFSFSSGGSCTCALLGCPRPKPHRLLVREEGLLKGSWRFTFLAPDLPCFGPVLHLRRRMHLRMPVTAVSANGVRWYQRHSRLGVILHACASVCMRACLSVCLPACLRGWLAGWPACLLARRLGKRVGALPRSAHSPRLVSISGLGETGCRILSVRPSVRLFVYTVVCMYVCMYACMRILRM